MIGIANAGHTVFIIAAVLTVVYIVLYILYNLGFIDLAWVTDEEENWIEQNHKIEIPSFSYTKKNEIVSAYQIGETTMPEWLLSDGLVVVIAPEELVVIPCEPENLTGRKGDFIVKYADNTYEIITEKDFKETYQHISLGE